MSSPPDGLGGWPLKSPARTRKASAPGAPRQGCADAGLRPPLTQRPVRKAASQSMVVGGSRGAPLFEVGPAPHDRARTQVHRSRKPTAGDQPVDSRAAQASGLDNRGQAREKARRLGGVAGSGCEAIHASGFVSRRCRKRSHGQLASMR